MEKKQCGRKKFTLEYLINAYSMGDERSHDLCFDVYKLENIRSYLLFHEHCQKYSTLAFILEEGLTAITRITMWR